MLDGIAIIIQALAWIGLAVLCLRRGKETEELKKQLDIKVMEIQWDMMNFTKLNIVNVRSA